MTDAELIDYLTRNGIHEKDAHLLIDAAKKGGLTLGEAIGALIQHGDNKAFLHRGCV